MPLALFLLKIALAIGGLLWFHMNLRIIFCFLKKCYWNFDGDCTESVDHF
jgi:hypothetical protein